MLIIPLTGKLSWRNPPFVTIAVILLNCLVWFFLQSGDPGKEQDLSEFYLNSGLAVTEISYYIAYRDGRLEEPVKILDEDEIDYDSLIQYFSEMQQDKDFQKKLEMDHIITPSDPAYGEWKDLKTEYQNKLSQLSTFKYGFTPAKKSILTSITHMFMHGSTGHLIGNMIFLWIFGCMLEMGLGRLKYTLLYLVSGYFAVWGFWLIYMNSTTPLVGASGAIAGLSGAFAVLFGRKKVKIFYSLGFYFNYLKIPALILLPIWLGKEFYQLFFGAVSNVAYVAHIGGIIGGAFIGFCCLKLSLGFDDEVIQEAPVDEISPLMEKALKHIAELDMEAGRKLLEEVLAKEPNNIDALIHLFNAYKLNPEDARFHQVTQKLIFELTRSYNTYEKADRIYNEYLRHTGKPRLSPPLYIQLSMMFAATGQLENAVKILTMLLKKVPDSPGMPTALLKLSKAYDRKGMDLKGRRCLQMICNKYPDSTEAQLAQQSLQSNRQSGNSKAPAPTV